MANEKFSGKERRSQTHRMIRELLHERQQVWALYCSVAKVEPFNATTPLDSVLREFCQILVDYISLGHFGIYQRLTEGTERRRDVLRIAEAIYPRIAETTQVAVEFNDKYEHLTGDEICETLEHDLSRLGEELASRIELEDQLVNVLTAPVAR